MKQVGIVVALLLASANIGEAQTSFEETGARLRMSPQLDLAPPVDQSDLRAAQLRLRAPVTLMVTGAVATVALGMSTALSSLAHCLGEGCDSSDRRTPTLFAATLAAASMTIASLAWLITRTVKRRRARAALRGLSVFGGGLRF